MSQIGPVAIVGGGIAGLTAALCLAKKGVPVDIVEQAEQFSAIGAGVQLSPNAAAILERLGLLPALEAVWTEPEAISLADGRTLKALAHVPSGAFARKRWSAPYGVLHRASLQRILLGAVAREPLCNLHLAQRMDSALPSTIASVTGRAPLLVVGADGVWSSARKQVPGSGLARFSGNLAYRLTIDPSKAPAVLMPSQVTAFLGPKAHIVAYPLKETNVFNLVAIIQGKAMAQSWNGAAASDTREDLLAALSGWHPALIQAIGDARAPTCWPLYEVTEGAWHDGERTVLIGDAAHAMMPFAAQGAAMAIEDAWALGAFLAGDRVPAAALLAFEAHRKARIKKVRARGAFNRFAYHARGPVRLVRDVVLSRRKPEDLAADLDWLYGHKPLD